MNPRLLAAAFLLLFICGPAPGAVGSCEEVRRAAEPVPYCQQREQLICWRRYLRGELQGGEAAANECRAQAIVQCRHRYWAPDCQPTERQTRACLNALRSYDTLNTPESKIEQCSVETLCQVYSGLVREALNGVAGGAP